MKFHEKWVVRLWIDILGKPEFRYDIPDDIEDAIDFVLSHLPQNQEWFVRQHAQYKKPFAELGLYLCMSGSGAGRLYKKILTGIRESRYIDYIKLGKREAEKQRLKRAQRAKSFIQSSHMIPVLAMGKAYKNLPTYYIVDNHLYWKLRDVAIDNCEKMCQYYLEHKDFKSLKGIGKSADYEIRIQIQDELYRVYADISILQQGENRDGSSQD